MNKQNTAIKINSKELGYGGEWQQIQLGKVCLKIGSGATPRGGKDAYRGGDITLIRSQNIYNDRFTRKGLAYINDSQAHELRNAVVEKNDVLLNITGDSVARCCQMDADVLPARVNQHVAIIRTQPDVLDARFLRYVLVNPSMQDHLFALASAGATRNALTKAMIESLDIHAPPIEEQRAIAHILGTLDDKIELNRKQNETLEAMAQALFKAWFVDFLPVRAKMAARTQTGEPVRAKLENRLSAVAQASGQSLPLPACALNVDRKNEATRQAGGLPAHLYDLFPDRLVDSELGEIPEGWEVTSIDREFNLTMGQSPPGETYNKEGKGLPFYQGRSDFGSRFPKRRVYCTAPTRLAKSGDTLISVRAPVGDINMALENCSIGRGIASVLHKNGNQAYTFQFMHGLKDVFSCFNAEGTVFGSISKKDFKAIQCIVPSTESVVAFEKQINPIDDQIARTTNESYTLSHLQDTLLPKLISGELRIADAEAFLKERGL